MLNRKRGGQPGNQNAVKHGRHSAPVRAARLAAWEEPAAIGGMDENHA